MPSLDALPDMTVDRLDGRRSLLAQLNDQFRALERVARRSTR